MARVIDPQIYIANEVFCREVLPERQLFSSAFAGETIIISTNAIPSYSKSAVTAAQILMSLSWDE